MSRLLSLTTFARRLRSDAGQSMALTATAMTVVLGMGAISVDMATWYQKHHQAQVAADAAALAAANCMADVGITGSTFSNQCTTTSDAANVATTYAADNGVTLTNPSDVTFGKLTVTVTTPDPAPALFAAVLGIRQSTQTATATATWSAPISNTCSTGQESSGACYLIFAKDTNCSDNTLNLSNNGNVTVTGGVWSNGNLNTAGADNNSQWGNVVDGNGSGCKWTQGPHNPKFTSGPTQEAPIATYPRDYSTVITACGTSGVTCGPSGTPSYCTDSAQDFTSFTPTTNTVYCAWGTGTPSDPSTWNGTITSSASSAGIFSDSFIGGTVNLTLGPGSQTWTPALSTSLGSLFVYAVGTGTAATISTQGSATVTGDIFAPNGKINASTQGSGIFTSFVEAQDVSINAGGGLQGDGPQTGSSGSSPLPGASMLTG